MRLRVATVGVAVYALGCGVAAADPAVNDNAENRDQHEAPMRCSAPTCTPEVQHLLAQVGPIPEPGPVPAEWPAPAVQVSVPVSVGLPGLPPPALLWSLPPPPQLPSPQDLPPASATTGLPPPPPPPGLPPPPWPF